MRTLRLVVLAVLSLAVLACSPSELKVTAVLPATGSLAPYGTDIRHGVELASEAVAARGGLVGGEGPLVLEVVDDGSDPERAAQAVRDAVEGGAAAIIGPIGDAALLEAAPVTDAAGIAMVTPFASATVPTPGYRTLTRVYPPDGLEAARLVAFIRKQLFLKDIVIFSESSPDGRSFKAAFAQSFERMRGTVQSTATFAPDVDDAAAAALVEDLRIRPGQGVVIAGSGEATARIVSALHAIDYVGEVFTTSSFHHLHFLQLAGEAANDVMYAAPAFRSDSQSARAFVEAWRRKHDTEPDVWGALGWDATMAIVDAVEANANLYPSDIPGQLRSPNLERDGVFGPGGFDANGEVVRELDVFGVVAGKPVPWSEYEATWKLRAPAASGS